MALGGIGKTRLAYQIAEAEQANFQHGVCFISLAEINHPDLIIPKLAEAIRLNLRSAREPKQQLIQHLRDKEMLLILDNCEHLLDALVLVSDLLKACEKLKILATSRERLNLQGEYVFTLEGLPYPSSNSETTIENYPAIALFQETARRIDSQFSLNNPTALIAICQLLEGMPLAIELAATWVRHLSLEQIRQELEGNSALLSSNLRDIPLRHRNIQFVFEETWRLLTAFEQNALIRLAVFQGQIQVEAAGEIARVKLPQLAQLAEKSLLQADRRGVYRIHQLLRRFLLDKLDESGEAQFISKKHAEYFAEHLKFAYAHIKKWRSTNENIRENYGNFAAALHFARESNDVVLFANLLSRLTYYWESGFRLGEALFWVKQGLEMLNLDTPETAQMQILIAAGIFHRLEPNISQAKTYLQQGIELARKLKSVKDLVDALHTLGHICLTQGQYDELEKIYEEHLFLARHLEDEYRIGRAYYNLANLALDKDNLPIAKEYALNTLEIYRRLELSDSAILCNLGLITYMQGNFAEAEAYFQESISRARIHNEIYNVVANMINLADVAAEHQKWEQASQQYLDAFETALLTGNHSGQMSSLESLSVVLGHQNYHAFATWLFSAVMSQRQLLSLPTAPFNLKRNEAALQNFRAALGDTAFDYYATKGKVTNFQRISQAIFDKAWLKDKEDSWI